MEPPTSRPSFSTGQKLSAGALVVIATAALLAIVAMVNFVAIRHFHRFALGSESTMPLSGVTRQVLKSLTNRVNVIVYYDPSEPLYAQIVSMLDEYSTLSSRIAVELVDHTAQPGRAREIVKKNNLDPSSKELVIFECNGKVATVGLGMLSELDTTKLMRMESNEVKRKSFLGERFFTSRILAVTDPHQPRAYFTTGHGEHSPEESLQDLNYGAFAAKLDLDHIAMAYANLLGTNEVPADCDLLIVAGPAQPFLDQERNRVEKYLNRGGRMLVLLRPNTSSNLEKMLGAWGLELADDVVIDPENAVSSKYDTLRMGNYGDHPIVSPLARNHVDLLIQSPRSIQRRQTEGQQSADRPQVTDLLRTGGGGVAIADFSSRQSYAPRRGDRRGEICVAAAVEKGSIRDVNLASTRLVVVGDSYLLDNQFLPANVDFARNAVNWLLDRSVLLGIAPQPFKEFSFKATEAQIRSVRLIVLVVVPGSVVLLGVLVWFRRRQ